MKTIWKVLIIFLGVLLVGFTLWVILLKQDVEPGAAREQTLRDLSASKEVVIVFNSGGWGNTPLEQATDFTPVLAGIQDSLSQLGYSSVIIPFVRTPRGLAGKIEDIKDYLESFKYSSEAMANEVQFILASFPGKRVIIAGFSNGGGLTERAMKGLADRPGVDAIVAGVPRWYQNYTSNRILVLDNNGKDKLADGDIRAIAAAVIKAPFRWLQAKIGHRAMNFARAIEIPGHEYLWSSSEVGPPIVDFIDASFNRR
jgi:dienelactone hydrolase